MICGCGCERHDGEPGVKCYPCCEPEAYEKCAACGHYRYAHNWDERLGTPGACAAYQSASAPSVAPGPLTIDLYLGDPTNER